MRKFLIWRLLPIVLVILAGWGGMMIIDNLEPDEAKVKKDKKLIVRGGSSTATGGSGSDQRGNAGRRKASSSISRKSTSNGSAADNQAASTAYNPDQDFVAGEVMILDPPDNFNAVVSQMGFTIIEKSNLEALDLMLLRLRVPPGMTADQAKKQLAARFPGLTLDVDHVFEPSQDQSRPAVISPTRRRLSEENISGRDRDNSMPAPVDRRTITSRARARIGWKDIPPNCGAGVRLGMIDTAVDVNHPALAGQKIETRAVFNPMRRPGPAGHGTAVAALLVGQPSDKGWGGLLPGADLKAANIFEISKTGKTLGKASSLLKAVNWLVREKVHVANIGLTGANNKTVRKALRVARKYGLVVVAAVGNRKWRKRRAYPAGYDQVVAVTAVGPYRGVMNNANRGSYVDFAAPGVRMWTAVPGGGGKYQSGTSFATTYVTALLALEISKGASKEPDSLRRILQSESLDLGSPGKDNIYGWGFIRKDPHC